MGEGFFFPKEQDNIFINFKLISNYSTLLNVYISDVHILLEKKKNFLNKRYNCKYNMIFWKKSVVFLLLLLSIFFCE